MLVSEALKTLEGFLPPNQRAWVMEALRGEDAEFFKEKMIELAKIVKEMPSTGHTDGQGDKAVAWLHYFAGGQANWYITEKYKGCEDDYDPTSVMYPTRGQQNQAFGLADLFGAGDSDCAEMGYISLPEIMSVKGELDFHWKPRPLSEVKKEHGDDEGEDVEATPEPTEPTTPTEKGNMTDTVAAPIKTETKPTPMSEKLFVALTERFKDRNKTVQQAILAHVRSKSGHQNLVAFHGNGANEEQKCELYKECLNAILNNDYSKLSGEVAVGQMEGDKPADVVTEPAKAVKVEPKPSRAVKPVVPVAAIEPEAEEEDEVDKIMAKLATALAAKAKPAPAPVVKEVDPAKIADLVAKEVKKQVLAAKFELLQAVEKLVKDTLKDVGEKIGKAVKE